jgi:hypothetical protein
MKHRRSFSCYDYVFHNNIANCNTTLVNNPKRSLLRISFNHNLNHSTSFVSVVWCETQQQLTLFIHETQRKCILSALLADISRFAQLKNRRFRSSLARTQSVKSLITGSCSFARTGQ